MIIFLNHKTSARKHNCWLNWNEYQYILIKSQSVFWRLNSAFPDPLDSCKRFSDRFLFQSFKFFFFHFNLLEFITFQGKAPIFWNVGNTSWFQNGTFRFPYQKVIHDWGDWLLSKNKQVERIWWRFSFAHFWS